VGLVHHTVRSQGSKPLLVLRSQPLAPTRAQAPPSDSARQDHFQHLAHHEPLTGLPNRLYLAEHLPNAIEVAGELGESLAILFLDLDL
jgi:GGDEF domain-containing protein